MTCTTLQLRLLLRLFKPMPEEMNIPLRARLPSPPELHHA